MSRHLPVSLTDEQRQHLDNFIKRGTSPARAQNRARILLLADRSQGAVRTHQQIADALLCSAFTVCQVCRRFATLGLDATLAEKPRPGQTPKITGDIEARLVTLACSEPPDGKARWTFKMLADKLVELQLVDSISEVAVYNRLKKRSQTVEGKVLVPGKADASVRRQNGGCTRRLRATI